MEIRPADIRDAEAISTLIDSVSSYFTLDPQGTGAEEFFQAITPGAIRDYLTDPSFSYLVAETDGVLDGVVAMKDQSHLFHLFVRPELHRGGIARGLWQAALDMSLAADNPPACITVNSSPYAVPVYERFGFTVTGPRQEKRGIAFVPMELCPKNLP